MKTKAMTQKELVERLGIMKGACKTIQLHKNIEVNLDWFKEREKVVCFAVDISNEKRPSVEVWFVDEGLHRCVERWSSFAASAKKDIQERIFESLTMEAE